MNQYEKVNKDAEFKKQEEIKLYEHLKQRQKYDKLNDESKKFKLAELELKYGNLKTPTRGDTSKIFDSNSASKNRDQKNVKNFEELNKQVIVSGASKSNTKKQAVLIDTSISRLHDINFADEFFKHHSKLRTISSERL